MNRGVWIVTKDGLIPKHLYHKPIAAQSDLPSPMLIRDGMDITLNPANGQRYDSKRAYEKAVRAAGCEIVGNERVKGLPKKMSDPVPDILRALDTIESRQPRKKRRKNAD